MASIRVLTLSGSLRQASSNTSLLEAAQQLAQRPLQLSRFDGIAALPHFSPDVEEHTPANELPAAVLALRHAVHRADAIIISCPEYARAVPGSFKNALDWLVGSHDDNKLVVLWNASPRSHDAQDSLRLILPTMLGTVEESASCDISLAGRKFDTRGILKAPDLVECIEQSLDTLTHLLMAKSAVSI